VIKLIFFIYHYQQAVVA